MITLTEKYIFNNMFNNTRQHWQKRKNNILC